MVSQHPHSKRFQEERKLKRLTDIFLDGPIPTEGLNARDYEVLLIYRNGSRDLRAILARSSVNAITLALRTAKGEGEYPDVAMVTCKVVA